MTFYTILNGCSIDKREDINNKLDQDTISKHISDFVFLFVGNISSNKNQFQVIEAYEKIPAENKINIKVIFVGGGNYLSLKDQIKKRGVENNLIVIGPVEREKLHEYYNLCDATILTSKSEGFGLSIIEGFSHGKPCLTFRNLGAIDDIYDERAVLLCENRTTEYLAEAMVKMTNIKWDHKFIEQYSELFSLDKMADHYIETYRDIIKR